MKKTMFTPRERRFLALAAAAAVCIVSLAFWYAVPPSPAQASSAAVEPLRESFRVDLNTAGVDELMTLPGIGEKRAADIVADREANGPFRIAEDITRVKGIGEGTLAGLIDYITVE